MSARLDFGCVWVNTHIPLVGEMPHGGFKHSGYGKDLSMYGFEDYTRIKHVMHLPRVRRMSTPVGGRHAQSPRRAARPAPPGRGRPRRQGADRGRGRAVRRHDPRHLVGRAGLRPDRHHRDPGRRGRRQDAGDHHRRLPADVLRGLRLPRAQQGRPGLRHLVHLDDEGLRPLRRVAGRLGGDPGHGDRAVEPGRRRRAVLLPVPRRRRSTASRSARCGRTAASTS